MKFKDYYVILGVKADADQEQIKASYRRLARKYHPDVSKEAGAEEKFKAVQEAYEVLRDQKRRQVYDQLREQAYHVHEEVQGFSDDCEDESDSNDIRGHVYLSLKTVYAGNRVRITLNQRQFNVRIPRGIAEGQVIRLAGQAHHGGNVLLKVNYAPDSQFEVDGRTIFYTLQLTPWQAALGTQVNVPTLSGTVKLKIPPGSNSGHKLRLRGRGLPSKNDNVSGDQIVKLEISTPAPRLEKQRQAYKALAQAFGVEY